MTMVSRTQQIHVICKTVRGGKWLMVLDVSSAREAWSGPLPVAAGVHTQPCWNTDNAVTID